MNTKSPSLPSSRRRVLCLAASVVCAVLICMSGCTSFSDYVHNGFKVGPNYRKPQAPVASEWIDSKARGVNTATVDLKNWWRAFNDPVLDSLIAQAYQQNLTLRSAGTRILAARAQRAIAVGNIFPQTQDATASVTRNAISGTTANQPLDLRRFFDQNAVGLNLSWEIDFWGRFRRGVEAATAELDASIENYDDALVILISDVANAYVQIRVFQERIRDVDENIAIQKLFVEQAEGRLKGGVGRMIDQGQMRSNLRDTLALREQQENGLRQANNQLCILLGIPVRNLVPELGEGPVPVAPPEAVVGIPADLLRRRPDLRRAERLVAAQSARIGIATSDLYPHITLIGSLGYEAENFKDLFKSRSFTGTIGPSVRWDILNYGRLVNGIRVQDALFQTAAVDYQNLALQAGREVEDGLVLFLRSQVRTGQLVESVKEAKVAVKEALQLSKDVKFDLNTAFVTSNFLTTQQDKLSQSKGDIALGFIQIYKALGGGWEIRCDPAPLPVAAPVQPSEQLPPPQEKLEPNAARFLLPRVAENFANDNRANLPPRGSAR